MRSLFSRSFPSFPRLSCAVPVLAVLCAVLFVWVGESHARPEYASIQAGFGPAKASYLPVTVGGKILQIKVPEDFVLAEGVEETEWYKEEKKRLVDAKSIPLLIFVLPDDLRMLKEISGHRPQINITFSAYLKHVDRTFSLGDFKSYRIHMRKVRDKLNGVAQEADEAPHIVNYIYEDDLLLALIFTPDISNSELVRWWPMTESHFLLGGKAITMCVESKISSAQTGFTLLKNFTLRYFER